MATSVFLGGSSSGGVKISIEENTTEEKLNILGVIDTKDTTLKYHPEVYLDAKNGVLMGAAWNDIAEFRRGEGAPGMVVCEHDDGHVRQCETDLAAGALIVSDTYGLTIGRSAEATVPIAIAGRVLVYHNGEEMHAGDAVCAAYKGCVRRMTREEIKEYPDRIVGYVSEIPSYNSWNGIEVNGRIWVRVK